jgi:hypothetical protein
VSWVLNCHGVMLCYLVASYQTSCHILSGTHTELAN